MALVVFGMVLPWLLVGLGCWLIYQLIQQNGRILLRLEGLEQRLTPRVQQQRARPNPLPVGTAAPAFDLPDLAGQRHTLADYRGSKWLLIFFNPQCGFCMQMTSALASLPAEGGPRPLVISTGKAEENRKLVEELGLSGPWLLQNQMEVAASYGVDGTPIGYLIDEEGRIASERTIGAEPLLKLAGVVEQPASEEKDRPCGCKDKEKNGKGKVNKGLKASRLIRDGLKAGTAAPGFRLPRVPEGELALEELRGRRVLLVFSDPECGPCEQLASQLEQLQRSQPAYHIVMVSRRDPEVNRRKVAGLGLTFPVVLQQSWEISRLYGMFATPIGYLIDEHGVLLTDVAQGIEAILALPNAAVPSGPATPASV
jgi:peroxiredoxin